MSLLFACVPSKRMPCSGATCATETSIMRQDIDAKGVDSLGFSEWC